MRFSAILVLVLVACVRGDSDDPFRRWLHNLTIPLPTVTLIDQKGLIFTLEGGLCGNTTLGGIYSSQHELSYRLQLDGLGLDCRMKLYLATKLGKQVIPLLNNETLDVPVTKSTIDAAITLVAGPGGFADTALGNVTVDLNVNPSFPGDKVKTDIIALVTAALKKTLDQTLDKTLTNLINNNLTNALQGINRQLRNITRQATKPPPLPLGDGKKERLAACPWLNHVNHSCLLAHLACPPCLSLLLASSHLLVLLQATSTYRRAPLYSWLTSSSMT